MNQYRILLWDIDGTILNFKAAEKHAFSECISRFFQIPCTDEMLKRYSALNETYWQKLERGEMSRDQILTERFAEYFRKEHLPAADPVRFNAAYHALLPETIVFNDDCLPMLKEFSLRFGQYAVTNGTKSVQDRKLEKTGLNHLFDGIFISEEIGCEKPSAAFFRYVTDHIPKTDKKEILMIGDSLSSDIRGGINAGIPVCWYNPAGQKAPAEMKIDYTIQNLNTLRTITGS